MSSCRIKVESINGRPDWYEVRRVERGDLNGYPILRDAYEAHESQLHDLIRQLKVPGDRIGKIYDEINIVALDKDLEWTLNKL